MEKMSISDKQVFPNSNISKKVKNKLDNLFDDNFFTPWGDSGKGGFESENLQNVDNYDSNYTGLGGIGIGPQPNNSPYGKFEPKIPAPSYGIGNDITERKNSYSLSGVKNQTSHI